MHIIRREEQFLHHLRSKTATCDVLAIHNNSAHLSTYGQWFPRQVSKLNLSQTNYEHAGRKFLNEESIKKGIRTPLVMASEAEVLGRLLWRVHLAAITQNCMKNITNICYDNYER